MKFITDEKLTIVGAAGMIGSNMVQSAIMLGLTPNICAYDPYAPALEGMAEEMYHCGFENIRLTYTSDIAEALKGAKYVVSSGGAARKAGMTREDLLKGNAGIAAELGKNLKTYCPDVKHVVVIFNPARYYRTDHPALLRSEAFAGNYPRCIGQHPVAKSSFAALQSASGQNYRMPYVWRTRRTDGSLRIDHTHRR